MIELLIMAICLALNALLSGMEMAFVSVGKPQLRDLARAGNKEAERVLSLRDNPERTLSVLQVGITLVGVLAAAVGGAGAEESITPLLESNFGLSENAAEVVTILGVTIPYTYLIVVIGELVPKSIALRNPTRVILKSARWLALLDKLFTPIIDLLEASTKKMVRILRFAGPKEPIKAATDERLDLESLTQEHRQYMLNLFDIRRKTVRDVLIPWGQVVSVHISQPVSEVAATIHTSGHTRLPVLSNGSVIGILHTKEFITLQSTGNDDWESLVRPVVMLRDGESLISALRWMQKKRSHLSVVLAGNRPSGIVTMEDVFEEIVGDIYDEDDDGRLRRLFVSSRTERLPQWVRRDQPGMATHAPSPPVRHPEGKSNH